MFFFFFSEEKKNRHSKIKLFISRSQHYFVFVELKSEIQVSFLSGWWTEHKSNFAPPNKSQSKGKHRRIIIL